MNATLEAPTPLIDLDLALSDAEYLKLREDSDDVCSVVRAKTLDFISEQLSPKRREATEKQGRIAEEAAAKHKAMKDADRSVAEVYRSKVLQRDAWLLRFQQVREQRQWLVDFLPSQREFLDSQSFGGGSGKTCEPLNVLQAIGHLTDGERGIVLADEWLKNHLPELEKLEAEVAAFEAEAKAA